MKAEIVQSIKRMNKGKLTGFFEIPVELIVCLNDGGLTETWESGGLRNFRKYRVPNPKESKTKKCELH